MAMPFQKDFDALLSTIVTDWRNQFPEADTSQGSLIFIKSACMALALWGIYKYQEWIGNQIFPDTAETEFLEHHAWVRGLSRVIGETDAELLTRLLDYIRRPPAGGNKYDYVKWALSLDYVAQAWCFPLGQGLGTVDVVILADVETTGSEVPSSHVRTGAAAAVAAGKLIDTATDFTALADPVRIGDIAVNGVTLKRAKVTAVTATELSLDDDIFTAIGQAYALKSLTVQVKEYIDDVRPVTASVVRVLPPSIITQNVAITVSGIGMDKTAIATEITSYLASLTPGQTLYLSRLVASAIQAGADNATASMPATDITPGAYEMIRPGTVSVM